MKMSDHLKKEMFKPIAGRSWMVRLFTASNKILGVSAPFKLPAKNISMVVLETGTLDHVVMTCVVASMVEHLRRITTLLKEMKDENRSEDDMLAILKTVDLDAIQEFPEDFVEITCGKDKDLRIPSMGLVAGNSVTIDHLEIFHFYSS